MTQQRVFILGASGFLGRNLLRALDARADGEFSGFGVSRNHTEASLRVPTRSRWVAETGWMKSLHRAVSDGHRVAVIHCAALTDHAYCETHPAETFRVNAEGVASIARVCRDLDVPLAYVSTDGLFGDRAPAAAPRYWSRADMPLAINTYARSKLGAEAALAHLGWGQSIRMSFVGPGLGTGRGLIAFLARQLRTPARKVPGFIDNWFTPAPVQSAAERLLSFAFGDAAGHGVHHWGSHPALTKYDYLKRVAEATGFRPAMIAVRRLDLPGAELIPLDQSLECEAPWSQEELIRQGVQALCDELELSPR